MHCLAGDIGGTKTLLAVFAREVHEDGNSFRVVRRERYDSGAYASLTPMLREFMAEGQEPITHVGIGVAGPVVDGSCKATNLPWELDEGHLASELGLAHVRLVNDFVAVALGIPSLQSSDLEVLQAGTDAPDPGGTIAILGAGTGLGEALLLPAASPGREPLVLPTEGGHTGLAPRNQREGRLLDFLQSKFGHVSWERVLSGPGIKNIYDFLVRNGEPQRPETRDRLEAEDPGAVIGALALTGTDPTCVATIQMFAELYGSEAGDLALKSLATGGVYIAGGIAPRLLPILKAGGFVAAFNDKGRMSRLTEKFRVSVVRQSEVGLIGACRAGLGGEGTSRIFV